MNISPVQFALWSTFISVSGWFVGHRMRLGGDAHNKRSRFRSFIQQIQKKVSATPLHHFAFATVSEFPIVIKQQPELDKEVIDVEQSIRPRSRGAFARALAEYRDIAQATGDEKQSEYVKTRLLKALNAILSAAK